MMKAKATAVVISVLYVMCVVLWLTWGVAQGQSPMAPAVTTGRVLLGRSLGCLECEGLILRVGRDFVVIDHLLR